MELYESVVKIGTTKITVLEYLVCWHSSAKPVVNYIDGTVLTVSRWDPSRNPHNYEG